MADKPAAPAADKGADAPKKMNPQVVMLIKNQFWILGAIAIVTAGVVWYLGVDALDKQFVTDKSKIDGQFSQMNQLSQKRGTNAYPNEFYTTEVNRLKKDLNGQVIDAWTNLFDRQTPKLSKEKVDLLAVNEDVEEAVHQGKSPAAEGRNVFRDLILLEPDERAAFIDANGELKSKIASGLQLYYNNQILDTEFKQLFSILNLRHFRNTDVFGKAIDGVPKDDRTIEGILVWNPGGVTPKGLRDRYRTTQNAPSIDRFAVTYEDIWTFRSLFGAIRSINSRPIDVWLEVMKGKPLPATETPVDQANVPIKRIEYCDLAQYSMTLSFDDPGDVSIQDPNASATPGPEMGGAMGGGGSGFVVAQIGNKEEDDLLLKGRYLDGRNAQVADPSKPPFTEFRQMYVQIRVLMDQRLIPVFIAECANAPLPIETRQIRITMDSVDEVKKQAAVGAEVNAVQHTPHDATVTLRGVVYIYTKPDTLETPEAKAKLGKGADPAPSKRDYGIPKKSMTTSEGT